MNALHWSSSESEAAAAAGASDRGDGSSEPPALPRSEFSLVHPIGLSAMDMDIIKLTAQYTAVVVDSFEDWRNESSAISFDFKPARAFLVFHGARNAYTKVAPSRPCSHREQCSPSDWSAIGYSSGKYPRAWCGDGMGAERGGEQGAGTGGK